MARPRRRSSSTFSLFAFQDIITSVTAIMILIVLIMALEFVTRSRVAGMAEDHRVVARQLKAVIADLESRLSGTRAELRDATKLADAVVGVDTTELRRLRDQELERSRDTDAAVAEAQARVEAAVAERQAGNPAGAVAELRKEQSRLESASAQSLELCEALEEECRGLAERVVAAQGSSPGVVMAEMVFNPPPSGSKRPAVVEVTGAGVAVAERPGDSPRSLGWGLLGPPSALAKWLRGLDDASESVLIVLRPSGVERFDAVRRAVLATGLDVGTELIGESTRVRAAGEEHP
jgi:hypothetical protein